LVAKTAFVILLLTHVPRPKTQASVAALSDDRALRSLKALQLQAQVQRHRQRTAQLLCITFHTWPLYTGAQHQQQQQQRLRLFAAAAQHQQQLVGQWRRVKAGATVYQRPQHPAGPPLEQQ
jgi:hypothetical protein